MTYPEEREASHEMSLMLALEAKLFLALIHLSRDTATCNARRRISHFWTPRILFLFKCFENVTNIASGYIPGLCASATSAPPSGNFRLPYVISICTRDISYLSHPFINSQDLSSAFLLTLKYLYIIDLQSSLSSACGRRVNPVNMDSANLSFEKLNSAISLYTPPLSTTAPPSPDLDPSIILVLQWMGASPNSRSLTSIYSKYASLVDTCATYKAHIGHLLPLKAIVLDSAPGQPTLKEGWAALSIGLPKGLLWYPSAVVLLVMFSTFSLSKAILGKQSIVDEVYNNLNDGELVSPKAARLYIYSEKDEIVGWRDVERHGKRASDAGVVVDTLRKTDTPHVQHVTKDAVRYWAKVESFWERVKHDS